MIRTSIFAAAGALAMSIAVSGSAQATVIGFDDLGGNQQLTPSGYNGLEWNNIYVLDATNPNFIPSGYNNGLVSSNNVAFNGFGGPASFFTADQSNFTLSSMFLTGAWNDLLDVLIEGYDNGNFVVNSLLTVSSLTATNFVFNWTGIDEVRISTSGGVDNPLYSGAGTHVAIDNISIDGPSPVPVPAALPLLLSALGGLVALRRRKRAV
jgi:hypothetical protein